MLYLVVTVTEGIKCILPERIITIIENTQFSELYEIFTSGQFNNQGIVVYICQNKVDKWVEVSDSLNSDLKIMEVLEYNHVKFLLLTES
ncbi:9875_t:CDS:1, partial [Funneliformis geosporum]